MAKPPKPEWSFLVDVDTISHVPAHYKIIADAETCAALAERYDVLGLNNVRAEIDLRRERGGLVIRIGGQVWADVTQTCVVTLDPMTSSAQGEIDAYFADSEQAISFAKARANIKAKKGEVEVEMIDEHDAPDEIVNGQIDLGEVAAQFLSLAIDPYPRSVDQIDASLLGGDQATQDHDEGKDTATSPFAALKAWRDGLK